MSHISRLKTKITELQYLREALNDLGYLYEEGEFEIASIGSQKATVQIRIKLPWSLDIGLRQVNGVYEILADWWGVRGVKKEEFLSRLLQRYAYRAALGVLQEKGFALATEEQQANGTINLVLRRMG